MADRDDLLAPRAAAPTAYLYWTWFIGSTPKSGPTSNPKHSSPRYSAAQLTTYMDSVTRHYCL